MTGNDPTETLRDTASRHRSADHPTCLFQCSVCFLGATQPPECHYSEESILQGRDLIACYRLPQGLVSRLVLASAV